MGCFSKGKAYQPPPAPKLPTAQELLTQGAEFGREQFPLAMGARERGLGYLQTPEVLSQYFQGFAPTTFEEGLMGTPFQNLMDIAQRRALHMGSLAGLPETAPYRFGEAMAPTIMNIGQFLAGQQQQRGMAGLEGLLGIDPMAQMIMPGAQLGAGQANLQAQLDYAAAIQQAQADVQKPKGAGLTGLLGAGLGALLAAPTGGMSLGMGALLGGAGGGMFGEAMGYGPAPMDIGQALTIAGGLQGLGTPGFGAGGAQTGITQPIRGGVGGQTITKANIPGGTAWSPYR